MKSMITLWACVGLLLATTGMAQAASPVSVCMSCHSFDKGGPNKIGPNLFGVYGSKVGSKAGFRYSPALQTHAWSWDEAHLRPWLCDTKEAVKTFSGDAGARVRMPAVHLCGDKADAIIAYLKTLK